MAPKRLKQKLGRIPDIDVARATVMTPAEKDKLLSLLCYVNENPNNYYPLRRARALLYGSKGGLFEFEPESEELVKKCITELSRNDSHAGFNIKAALAIHSYFGKNRICCLETLSVPPRLDLGERIYFKGWHNRLFHNQKRGDINCIYFDDRKDNGLTDLAAKFVFSAMNIAIRGFSSEFDIVKFIIVRTPDVRDLAKHLISEYDEKIGRKVQVIEDSGDYFSSGEIGQVVTEIYNERVAIFRSLKDKAA